MSNAAILKALDEHLSTFSWTCPYTGEVVAANAAGITAWPGIEFKPRPDFSWLRPTLLPLSPQTNFRGHPISFTARGFYEVQARRPETYGDSGTQLLGDAIADHFYPKTQEGLYLNADGVLIVQIEIRPDVQRLKPMNDAKHLGVSVSVRYFAQVPRTG